MRENAVGVGSAVGKVVGTDVGVFVGAAVGDVGTADGADVGKIVGTGVGTGVGTSVGSVVGWNVGVGRDVGTAVGVFVGVFVGAAVGDVGTEVGAAVGTFVAVVGSGVGTGVGKIVGTGVGKIVGTVVSSSRRAPSRRPLDRRAFGPLRGGRCCPHANALRSTHRPRRSMLRALLSPLVCPCGEILCTPPADGCLVVSWRRAERRIPESPLRAAPDRRDRSRSRPRGPGAAGGQAKSGG